MHDAETDRRRRRDALKLLATLRQAEVDATTAAAYLLGVSDLPPEVLEQAVKDIGYRAREDHEAKWPELGTVRARCDAILRHRRELQQAQRPRLESGDTPVDPEKWKNFRSDVDALLKRKVMP